MKVLLKRMRVRDARGLGHIAAARRVARLVVCAFVLSLALMPNVAAQSPTDDLFQAVRLNDQGAVEAALDAGASLGATDENQMTPADLAVDLGHFRIAHFLLARRLNGADNDPRVTERGRAALRSPSTPRSSRGAPETGQQTPSADLAQVDVPAKPAVPQPRETTTPQITPPTQSAPDLNAPSENAAVEPPSPIVPRNVQSNDQPYSGDEPTALPDAATAATEPTQQQDDSGVLGAVWGGIKNVVTLGGLLGGGDEATTPPPEQPEQRRFTSPAERFYSPPPAPSESAAGRMVDRMRDVVGGQDTVENEFGLPQLPTIRSEEAAPPLPSAQADAGALDIPGLAAPPPGGVPGIPGGTLDQLTVAPPISAPPPPTDTMGIDIPGLSNEFPTAPRATAGVDIPGIPATVDSPPTSSLDIPGLPATAESPTQPLDIPGFEGLPAEPDPGIDIPGLPPGLDFPSTAQTDIPLDEVPGIIPPPDPSAVLPPGLESLPGGDPDRLRRPDGLVTPDDPNVLPTPGARPLAERLRRFDDLLSREPGEVRQRFAAPPVSTAPEKPPVRATTLPSPDDLPSTPSSGVAFDPAAVLQRAREGEAMQREIERRAGQTVGRPQSEAPLRAPVRVQAPPPVITTRKEPAERLVERLRTVGTSQYQDEDIHGLPIVRPQVEGQPIKQEIQISELEAGRRDQTDQSIQALARFFRADQEETAGMQPPEIETAPLPRVIDNLIPENDPSRGRIVDDSLLDLEGVGFPQSDPSNQRGDGPAGRLDPNFIDRLGSVLGPARTATPSYTGDVPQPDGIDLQDLNVPNEQLRPETRPDIPDPWTMTVERSGPGGEEQTLGVSSISPQDGSELAGDDGVVTSMIGRIRNLLAEPPDGPQIDDLDDQDRQQAAEDLLSEALRDGTPMALPDQTQWSVTEVETANAPPGVPPQPRPGALTRTSLEDVILSLGQSVTLENTLPPQQNGLDPLNECVKKNRGTTLFCVEPIDWPVDLNEAFLVPTILYTGTMAITRYDQGTPSRFHSLFDSEDFEDVVAYYQAQYGEPTEIWKRSIAPLAKPRMDNPTVTWRSRNSQDNVITVLEIRKFDDSRGGFPDTTRGAVMLYYNNAASIFPQVSSHELMRLRRTR